MTNVESVNSERKLLLSRAAVRRSVAFLFNKGATVDSCIMKLIHANSPIIVLRDLRDIHRPKMPASHDGLSKAQRCLWYLLANWEDKNPIKKRHSKPNFWHCADDFKTRHSQFWVLSWCTGSQGNNHCSFFVKESLVSCCVLFGPL